MGLDLLSLPVSVLFDVLCSQLTLKELVRLDSAFCNSSREPWRTFLRSKQCTFNVEIDISPVHQLQWIQRNNLKASSLKFFDDSVCVQLISKYLQSFGSTVRTISFEDWKEQPPMNLVSTYCKNLTVLRVRDMDLTSAFNDILWCNPNIQEIKCNDVVCADEGLFANLSLHKLQKVLVDMSYSGKEGFPWHETAHSDSLHTAVWTGCDSCSGRDMVALAKNCPQLRSFSCDMTRLDSSHLRNFSLLSLHLLNFNSSFNDSITDEDVFAISKNWASLRTLNLQYCEALTDKCLQYLAEHCGNTLEVLHIDIKHPESEETEKILEIFALKCVKLQFLKIDCRKKSLCSGRGTSLLVRGCPQLRTLLVDDVHTICPSSLDFIGVLRPDLRVRVHDENTTDYDILTMPID